MFRDTILIIKSQCVSTDVTTIKRKLLTVKRFLTLDDEVNGEPPKVGLNICGEPNRLTHISYKRPAESDYEEVEPSTPKPPKVVLASQFTQ